jgi:hypothetical protein
MKEEGNQRQIYAVEGTSGIASDKKKRKKIASCVFK